MDEKRIAEIKRIFEDKQKFIEKEKSKAALICAELKEKKFCASKKKEFWNYMIQDSKRIMHKELGDKREYRSGYSYSTGYNRYLLEYNSSNIEKSNYKSYCFDRTEYFDNKGEFVDFIEKIEKIAKEKIKSIEKLNSLTN